MRQSFNKRPPRQSFFDLINGRTFTNGASNMSPLEVVVQHLPHSGLHVHRFSHRVFLRGAGNWGQYHDIGPHTYKGYMYEGNRGTGIIGKWYAVNHNSGGNSVVRKSAGGAAGTGWGLGWGDAYASSTFGRVLSLSQTAGDTAIFTYTGCAMGLVGIYGRTSGGIAFVSIDGDWTKANGHCVQTVTSATLATWTTAGKTTFTDVNNAAVTIAVGMKYIDFNCTVGGNDATALNEELLIWEGTEGAHTLVLTVAGWDYAGSTSNKQVAFSAFFGSSATMGLIKDAGVNGTQYLLTAADKTASGWYILKDREVVGARGYANLGADPAIGADVQVLGGVYEVKGKRAGTVNLFCEETHADGTGNTWGPYEQGSGFRTLLSNATSSAAGQAVFKLFSGHGTGVSGSQVYWHEAYGDGQVLTVSSVSTDDVTMTGNITTATGASAYERLIYCQGTLSGAVSNSKSGTLSTATNQIIDGSYVAILKAGQTPIVAMVKTRSGASLTFANEITAAAGSAVLLLATGNTGTVMFMDDIAFYLQPGAIWGGSNFECRVYSATGCHEEATTLSAAISANATSFSVTSATNIKIGDIVNVDCSKCQFSAKVTNVVTTTVTVDRAVPFYVNNGARVVAAHTLKYRTYSAGIGQVGFIEQRMRWLRGGDSYRSGYPYMINNGKAIRFASQGAGQLYYDNEGFSGYCILNADGSVVRNSNPTYPTPAYTSTAGGTTTDTTTAGGVSSMFLYGARSGNRGTPVFMRQPIIRNETTRSNLGASGSLVRVIADGSIKAYPVRSSGSISDADLAVIPPLWEHHAICSVIAEIPGAAAAINNL